jgi:lipopolysaccharide/colanic/teichoic acid biosynthesis glycosyltransferase
VRNVILLEGARAMPRTRSLPNAVATRTRDIMLATVLLVVLAPLLLVIAFAVAVSSPGPVLFRQQRLGRDQRRFSMLKFRTMAVGSDDRAHRDYVTKMFSGDSSESAEDGLFKLTEDERITRVGGVLRRLSLDEFPQLLNVLAGQMSLVGPRPALPWEVKLFQPRHLARFQVKPGMTGLWQVKGRSKLSMPQALELDVEYVERRTFWLDLGILIRTIPVVISGSGAS